MTVNWRHLTKSSINILSVIYFARNVLLVVYQISGFAFDVRLLWEIKSTIVYLSVNMTSSTLWCYQYNNVRHTVSLVYHMSTSQTGCGDSDNICLVILYIFCSVFLSMDIKIQVGCPVLDLAEIIFTSFQELWMGHWANSHSGCCP